MEIRWFTLLGDVCEDRMVYPVCSVEGHIMLVCGRVDGKKCLCVAGWTGRNACVWQRNACVWRGG